MDRLDAVDPPRAQLDSLVVRSPQNGDPDLCFLTSEHGREGGVRDYTGTLAKAISGESGGRVRVSCPALLSEARRTRPTLISLQYVPYAWHSKGLPFGLAKRLLRAFPNSDWHLMFHEISMGDSPQAGVKGRVTNLLQRWIACDLAKRLRPRAIHTTNQLYVSRLAEEGVSASALPLFSNVPVIQPPAGSWLSDRVGNLNPTETCLVGLFGAIHPNWNANAIVSNFCEAIMAGGRRPIFAHVGRSKYGEGLMAKLQTEMGDRGRFVALGERSLEEISSFLSSADFGLSTTPWGMIGKSGTTVAMREHGVPVLCVRTDQATPPPPADPGLRWIGDCEIADFIRTTPRWKKPSALPLVAAEMIRLTEESLRP